MEELPQEQEFEPNSDDNHLKSVGKSSSNPSETSDTYKARGFVDNLKDSISDDDAPRKRTLKRVKRFSDSDSDSNKMETQNEELFSSENTFKAGKSTLQSDDSENDTNTAKSIPHKFHKRKNRNISDSESEDSLKNHQVYSKNKINRLQDDCDSKEPSPTNSDDELKQKNGSESDNAIKNVEQQLRMKNKRNKLKDKFKSLLKIREKELLLTNDDGLNEKNDSNSSSESGEEMASIENIKQKIKERMSFKPSICDPDTSDEENNQQIPIYKKKKEKERKTKLISPKPQRMSAKQAMENMQKIKSESNRMLREKEVSLPYHRSKALSLKDIMSRRKLAVSSDGKALPIKMNREQLTQYAQMLEERQKEMMELCKSESEDEETNENEPELVNGTTENSTEVLKSTAENHEEVNTVENSEEVLKDTPVNVEVIVKNSIENESDDANSVEKCSAENTGERQIKILTESSNHLNNHVLEMNSCTENAIKTVVTDQISAQILEDQDSDTNMKLVYNDSANSIIEENFTADVENHVLGTANDITAVSRSDVEKTKPIDTNQTEIVFHEDSVKNNSERDSQLISLHLETENTDCSNVKDITDSSIKGSIHNSTSNKNIGSLDEAVEHTEAGERNPKADTIQDNEKSGENEGVDIDNEFSDDDINMVDIDNIIENAEIIKDIEDKVNSQFLVRDKPLNLNPKLTGAPGMVIDLDDSDTAPRKSGVELLKERYTYFSKLKTPEEIEREREKKLKPGTQLKKLKQELEEKIAEQRSLEWAKRLEEEKQQQKELKELRGEESDEDDIDKIEAAIEEKEEIEVSEESDSGEEEPIENDIEIKDKPRVKNSMVDDEAEESDDENGDKGEDDIEQNDESDTGIQGDDDGIKDDDGSESDESDESSESEEEQTVTKKGRILKAFEDSDDEDAIVSKQQPVAELKDAKETSESKSGSSVGNFLANQIASQDDELQLAQRPKSTSDDLFTSQESVLLTSEAKEQAKDITENDEAFTQTFSILDSSKPQTAELDLNTSGKLMAVETTQSLDINNMMDDVSLCPVTDSLNLPLLSQIPTSQSSQSQPIGEDILALCTGQFYNNQFLSQVEPLGDSQKYDAFDNYQSQDSQEEDPNTQEIINTNIEKERQSYRGAIATKETENFIELNNEEDNKVTNKSKDNLTDALDLKETENFIELNGKKDNKKEKAVDDNLKSILDELADPEFDSPKPNKFFVGGNNQRERVHTEIQMKRKLVIDSDDENIEGDMNEPKKLKKLKKKKAEKRALQISDDEEEQSEIEDLELESDIEEDNVDRLVEYDSEENEIEVKPQNPKKKRKMTEFFENEAELTSEDEWVGSGDEDEAGLDRMEREAGDDDTFHQGELQRELGQIHMRDVLDQDKREVRLIQELLFEDGDLGAGGRQRKFRWNNMGDEETGTVPDEFADTQEEEFESEEQWRKQRHEREMFLKQLQNKDDPEESLNVSVNRTTIIKANLLSKTMSSLLMEVNNSTSEKTESPTVEKKTAKDIPSPKKPFALLQQSYQGSVLSRGRGALARLAALATPLAADEDARGGARGPTSRRNFVFASLTPDEKEPKVMKRRAENLSTPKLVKKIRTEEKNAPKNSLLDHFKL